MRKKIITFLLGLINNDRTELSWWDDIRNGDKTLEIRLSEYDLVTMSNLKRTRIENLVRQLIAEIKEPNAK